MRKAQALLNNLRILRLEQRERADRAGDLFAMATRGMGSKRARDTGGTGECPLSRYGPCHADARVAVQTKVEQADAIWARIEPLLADVDFDAGSLIALFYNEAMEWDDMRAKLKRSEASCQRMHRDMVRRLDGLL